MTSIPPATSVRSAKELRILVVDPPHDLRIRPGAEIASLFEPGDLVVLNDAATVPASFHGSVDGKEIELRLVTAISERRWTAAIFGAGDYHTKTEDRPAPPPLQNGSRIVLMDHAALEGDRNAPGHRPQRARSVRADVGTPGQSNAEPGARGWNPRTKQEVTVRLRTEPRLIDIDFDPDTSLATIWQALYRLGRPVQYAHVPEPLALWDVQNVYAARPWAVEMPSAGRAIRFETLLELSRRNIEIARVTHAAGLSSIGDASVDAMLPLPERFEVTEATWEAIARTKKRKGRVIAIGTSTARALEGGARSGQRVGITDLRIGAGTRRAIVDAIVTGVHDTDTSHYSLLRAFASDETLRRALEYAVGHGMLGHELGDACLVFSSDDGAAR